MRRAEPFGCVAVSGFQFAVDRQRGRLGQHGPQVAQQGQLLATAQFCLADALAKVTVWRDLCQHELCRCGALRQPALCARCEHQQAGCAAFATRLDPGVVTSVAHHRAQCDGLVHHTVAAIEHQGFAATTGIFYPLHGHPGLAHSRLVYGAAQVQRAFLPLLAGQPRPRGMREVSTRGRRPVGCLRRRHRRAGATNQHDRQQGDHQAQEVQVFDSHAQVYRNGRPEAFFCWWAVHTTTPKLIGYLIMNQHK